MSQFDPNQPWLSDPVVGDTEQFWLNDPVFEETQTEDPSVLEDVALSVGSGIQKGVAGTIGLPSDVVNLSNAGRIALDNEQLDKLSDDEKGQVVSKLEEMKAQGHPWLKNVDPNDIMKKKEWQNVGYGQQEALSDIQDVTGFDHEAQTGLGNVVERGVEFMTGLLTSVGATKVAAEGFKKAAREALTKEAAKAMTTAGAAGVGSEMAGQLTEGTALEPVARIAGAVAGGAGSEALSRIGKRAATPKTANSTARKMIKERIGDGSDAGVDQALDLQAQAQAQGTPLMGPEALNSRSLRDLASDVSQSEAGSLVFDKFLAGREQGVKAKMKEFIDRAGPDISPKQAHKAVTEAAEGAINNATKARTKATTAYYKAAESGEVDRDAIKAFVDRLDSIRTPNQHPIRKEIADFKGMLTKENGDVETNVGMLNEAYKLQRDARTQITPNSTATEKYVASQMKPIVKDLGKTLEDNAPALKRGNEVYQRITKQIVEPLKESRVGDITRTREFKPVLDLLLNPDKSRPRDVIQSMNKLADVDPSIPSKVLRVHLDSAVDKAMKVNSQANVVDPGTRVFKELMGTEKQRANLLALSHTFEAANGLPHGTYSKALKNTFDIFSRMATVPKAGSPTARRGLVAVAAGEGGVGNAVAATADVTKGSLIGAFRRAMTGRRQEETLRQLAEIFTDPRSVEKIMEIAQAKPDSYEAAVKLAGTLGIAFGQEHEKPERQWFNRD